MPKVGNGQPLDPQTGKPLFEIEHDVVVSSVRGRNLGDGVPLFSGTNGKSKVLLDFKSLVAGNGIAINLDVDEITIEAVGGGVDLQELQAQLALGTMSKQNSGNVAITGGNVSGVSVSTASLTLVGVAASKLLITDETGKVVSADVTWDSVNTRLQATTIQASTVMGLVAPVNSGDATNKSYVDSTASSLQSNIATIQGSVTTLQGSVSTLQSDLLAVTRLNVNTQSGTTVAYTLTAADSERTFIRVVSTNPATVTVPPDSSVNMPIGSAILVGWAGVGQVEIAPGAGVTINTPDTLKIGRQHGKITIIKVAANTWDLEGNLEPSS